MTLQHHRSSSVEKNDFTYLGSLISSDNGAHKDITARFNTAMCAFILLANIRKSIAKQYSLKTTIRPYYSVGKALLVYGSACWRVTKGDMRKVDDLQYLLAQQDH